MSVWIHFVIDTGGSEPAMVDDGSISSGTWGLKDGRSLRDLNGKLAGDCIEAIRETLYWRDPLLDDDRRDQPNRTWEWMLRMCINHPKCTITIG